MSAGMHFHRAPKHMEEDIKLSVRATTNMYITAIRRRAVQDLLDEHLQAFNDHFAHGELRSSTPSTQEVRSALRRAAVEVLGAPEGTELETYEERRERLVRQSDEERNAELRKVRKAA